MGKPYGIAPNRIFSASVRELCSKSPRKELRIAAIAATRKYHASVREFVLPKLEYRYPLDRGLVVYIPKPYMHICWVARDGIEANASRAVRKGLRYCLRSRPHQQRAIC